MFEGINKGITLACWLTGGICLYLHFAMGGTWKDLLTSFLDILWFAINLFC